MRRRLFLLTPIAALISACVGSGDEKSPAGTSAPGAANGPASGDTPGRPGASVATGQAGGSAIPAAFPTVHWVHATH
ncbi:MAG: hypothetical protein R3B97_05240 [Dehalococcoidia bacterium]|nr:hypothetical protein [Dehalococcoidia bacterium]